MTDQVPSISPEGAESFEVLIANLCLCAEEIRAQYGGTATTPLSPQCATFALELGDPTDGEGTVTLRLPAR